MAVVGGTEAGRWLLSSDEVGVSIRAPLELRELTVEPGLRVVENGGFSDGEMFATPVANQTMSVSLMAEFHADHAGDDIRPEYQAFEKLTKKDSRLGRRPKVTFVWGDVSIVDGWLSNARQTWSHGMFDGDPPLPRAFQLSFTVKRARGRQLEKTTKLERNTRHLRLNDGDSFELIALRQYGDPNLGEALRRLNTTIPVEGEQAGDLVQVPDRDNSRIRDFALEPASPALLGDVRDVLQAMCVERIGKRGPGLFALEEELGLR